MVDGYIEPLRQEIAQLADRVSQLENLSKPEDRAAAAAKVAEAKAEHLKKNPGQTLHARRMPITPGLPIAPALPEDEEPMAPMTITEGKPAFVSPADQIKAKRAEIAALESNMDLTPAARAVQIGRLNREINDLQSPPPPKPVIPPPPPPAA